MNSLVSIIIPTCKRPNNLLRAVNSVLHQTYNYIEIIVVDDNGNNTVYQHETESLLQDYISNKLIKYIKMPSNKGGAAARNLGINFAKGDYVGFLDDDDVFVETKIEYQVNRLESINKKYGCCYCQQCLVYNNIETIIEDDYKEGNLTQDILLFTNHLNTSCLLFRKDTLINLGGFDESFRRHQDWELLLRYFQQYNIAIDLSKQPQVRRFIDSVRFEPQGKDLVLARKKFLNKFKSLINTQSNHDIILHKQWQMVYEPLLRSKQYYWGAYAVFMANFYKKLSYREIRWIVARILKKK